MSTLPSPGKISEDAYGQVLYWCFAFGLNSWIWAFYLRIYFSVSKINTMSSKTKKHGLKILSGSQEKAMIGQTKAKQKKRKVDWTNSVTELPQKMHKKLKKSHTTEKMPTTQTAILIKLCQIVMSASRGDSGSISPLNFQIHL